MMLKHSKTEQEIKILWRCWWIRNKKETEQKGKNLKERITCSIRSIVMKTNIMKTINEQEAYEKEVKERLRLKKNKKKDLKNKKEWNEKTKMKKEK